MGNSLSLNKNIYLIDTIKNEDISIYDDNFESKMYNLLYRDKYDSYRVLRFCAYVKLKLNKQAYNEILKKIKLYEDYHKILIFYHRREDLGISFYSVQILPKLRKLFTLLILQKKFDLRYSLIFDVNIFSIIKSFLKFEEKITDHTYFNDRGYFVLTNCIQEK